MDITIPKELLNKFSDDLENYQLNILNNIHKKYLQNHIRLEEFHNHFEQKHSNNKIKKKLIISTLDNKDRCEAKVWNNGSGSRCKNKKREGIDYCIKHFYKKNYGRFDE